MNTSNPYGLALNALLLAALALQGCTPTGNVPPASAANQTTPAAPTNSTSLAELMAPGPTLNPDSNAPTAVTASYTPPSAAELIQLLAPVAVFPDTLVAQVLAASSQPDQVSEAYAWYQRNNGLRGTGLQNAVDQQTWDPSVKAIATFPDVLHQMASNLPWTTALGEAYVNDPTDVMNAIQSLRQQAIACNNLKSNQYLTVTTIPKNNPAPLAPADVDEDPQVYSGPPMIPSPQQIIEIAPAQPDYVYVPQFDPGGFYGTPFGTYPGYVYAWPAPVYAGPLFGAFAFGIGVGIDFGHPWGWGRWGMHWGPGFGRPGFGYGLHRPAVVYNNRAYVGHSAAIVNHFDGRGPDRFAGAAGIRPGASAAFSHAGFTATNRIGPAPQPMTTPHFSSTMAAHTSTFQTGRAPMSAALRSDELPSSRFAPASATRAGFNASSTARVNAERPAASSFAERSQFNTPRTNGFSNGSRYSAPGASHGFAPSAAHRSFGGSAPHLAQQRNFQVAHSAPRAASTAHAAGGRSEHDHR